MQECLMALLTGMSRGRCRDSSGHTVDKQLAPLDVGAGCEGDWLGERSVTILAPPVFLFLLLPPYYVTSITLSLVLTTF